MMAVTRPIDSLTTASKIRAVTPHATNFIEPCRGLWVGVQGDVSVIAVGDTAAVILKGAVGFVPVAVKAVRVSGTDATDIVALY